ncbi:MAG: serine hydrolase domain-containing protein, partial [Gemmatimonadales bacterium]
MRVQVNAAVVALLCLAAARPAAGRQESAGADLATRALEIERLVFPHEAAELLSGTILVARGEQVLYRGRYGYANWELREPVNPSTRFGIGSITKAMTEIVVRSLAAEGRLDLDAPVDRYLDGFPAGPAGGKPTIRHLLVHRAGVPHRVTADAEEATVLRPAAVVERVRAAGLLFEPGSRRQYSSAGYTVLARVVEVVTGRPFADVLAERVFEPAGMRGATEETGRGLMTGRAAPYLLGVDAGRLAVEAAPYKDLRFLTGAGSVYATADDLLRFMRALRAGVFGAELAAEMYGGDPGAWVGLAGRTGGYEASVDLLPGA